MKRNSGFTLVDLMVALAILAIVLSAVFALFHSHERTVRAAGEERDLYAEAALILDRLTHDITGAWLPTLPSEGQAKYIFAAEPGRLDFTTTAGLVPGKPAGSEIMEVGYRLETKDDESGLFQLIRRQDNTVDDTPDDGGWTIVLSQRIIRMTVMYADSNGQMEETFNTEQRSELPQVIAVTLVMADTNDREKTFATTVSPALAQGVVPNLFENGDLTQ